MAQAVMPRAKAIGREFVEILRGKQLLSGVREKAKKELQQIRDQISHLAPATPNGAPPLSQGDLNIEHVFLSSTPTPPEGLGPITDDFQGPAWAMPPRGPQQPIQPVSEEHESVQRAIQKVEKHYSKITQSTGRKIAKTAGLIALGAFSAILQITPVAATSIALMNAASIGVLGVTLLLTAIFVIKALASGSAVNKAKKSFKDLINNTLKEQILAEVLLTFDETKKAKYLLLSPSGNRPLLIEITDNIEAAKQIIADFKNGERNFSVDSIDKLLRKFHHAQELSFYGELMKVKEHMEDLEETERMLREGVD